MYDDLTRSIGVCFFLWLEVFFNESFYATQSNAGTQCMAPLTLRSDFCMAPPRRSWERLGDSVTKSLECDMTFPDSGWPSYHYRYYR